jgi:hypothetical protein
MLRIVNLGAIAELIPKRGNLSLSPARNWLEFSEIAESNLALQCNFRL